MRKQRCDSIWTKHPEYLEELKKWYPHIGPKKLSQKLNLNKHSIRSKAAQLGITVLPFHKRLCCDCLIEICTSGRHRCRECYNKHHAEQETAKLKKNPIAYRLYDIFYGIKKRDWKAAKIDFDWKYLLEIYNKQNGRCYYTGVKLEATEKYAKERNPNTISIERLDSSKGYTKDNIVLCTWWANNSKWKLTKEEFIRNCKSVVENMGTSCNNDQNGAKVI